MRARQSGSPFLIPTTAAELDDLGWSHVDIILVTGDTYIDSPFIGAAVIGRVLLNAGFKVAIIAQPDLRSSYDISRLGEPGLFWGVTSGSVDSMVANYTALGKRRKTDDFTPGGLNTRRPDRAVIVYSNLIRRYFKRTRPIVLGGIEASLRRISHYDAWSDSVRRSILFDAKADLLVYGMAEQSVTELAEALRNRKDISSIRGICFIRSQPPDPSDPFPGTIELPDHKAVSTDPMLFIHMFHTFYANSDAFTAKRLIQRQDTRYLVHNPPQFPISTKQLDRVHELAYSRKVHPFYAAAGQVPAQQTISFALTSHRGCYGECRFCAIAVHQGRHVTSRSLSSLVREATSFVQHPDFKGVISDVGGPTANMYGFECARKKLKGACPDKACLFPRPCRQLRIDHSHQIQLLRALRSIQGIVKVFIASGVRHDLVVHDLRHGHRYLQELLAHHISGQLKLAPEHIQDHVLELMGKPGREDLTAFLRLFEKLARKARRKSFLSYYLMAAHPGCTLADMKALRQFSMSRLRLLPEQVQIFTPTPATYSTLMYYTGQNPFTGVRLFVERSARERQEQKNVIRLKKQRRFNTTKADSTKGDEHDLRCDGP
jgi:uncharacterized radical SAM protein YgiQ